MSNNRSTTDKWDVLLIGGASGTGKTSISYRLAQQFGVGITEVDDLHLVLETMTTPAQQPILHYWATKPESVEMLAQEILDLHISVCRVLAPALLAVINNHVVERTAIILEGDYILPELLLQWREQNPARRIGCAPSSCTSRTSRQIIRNFLQREPDEGEQQGRAHVSRLFGNWLHHECIRDNIPVVSARPWATRSLTGCWQCDRANAMIKPVMIKPVITNAEQVTPEWLSRVLTASSVLTRGLCDRGRARPRPGQLVEKCQDTRDLFPRCRRRSTDWALPQDGHHGSRR